MELKEKAERVVDILDACYPLDTTCYLRHENPWQLMIATILSAQCTDDRVNRITAELFQKYPSVAAFAYAKTEELEQDIFTAGFYRGKAKNIIGAMQKLLTEYNEEIPSDIGQLTRFPGVGRKTANVIRGHIFHIQSIVVDTHVKRIAHRLGLTKNTDPVKVEFDLMAILPESAWIRTNTQMIAHGRKICTARKPDCAHCALVALCDAAVAL